jgi:hypothetical protein
MGTIYSALTAEMQARDEGIRLPILGGGEPTVSDDFSMGGTYSRRWSGPTNPGDLLTPASNEFTCGQWIKTNGAFSDTWLIAGLSNQAGTPNWAWTMYVVWDVSDQQIKLYADDSGPSWIAPANFVLLHTVNLSTTLLQTQMNWMHLSFYVDWQINFTVSAYLDGIQILTYTAGTNWEWLTAPSAVNMFKGTSAGTDITYADDAYVEDVNGEGDQVPQGYQFVMAVSDGAGSSTDWTPGAGNNWEQVNEDSAPDDDTTYVEESVSAELDLYTFVDLTEGPSTELPEWSYTPIAVYMQSFYRQVDDSEVTDASYDHYIWDGALSSTDGPFTDADDFDWHMGESVFPLQPDGTAWNLIDFNAWTYGIETN